jgi:hypothetical protein
MVLTEDRCLHETFVQLARLFNFALHKLAAEPVVFVDQFDELLLRERPEQSGLSHVTLPVHIKTF